MGEIKNDNKMINIYDIAEMSGVSIATVSRVVNNNPKVSEKTKAKVMEAIKQSGYTPNVFADSSCIIVLLIFPHSKSATLF